MVLDTGGRNIIDPAVARAIGATAAGDLRAGGVGANTVASPFARVRSLRIGAAELRDQSFIVIPVRAGFGRLAGAPLDGIVGFEVLSRFLTTIDYARARLTLRLPGGTEAPGVVVPFVSSEQQPEIACRLDGIAGRCAVDTGSGALDVFSPFIARHPSVVPVRVSASGTNGAGVGGADLGRIGRLASLEVGGFALHALTAGVSAATEGVFASDASAANVGGNVWKRFTVGFDYPHSRMTLAPNAAFDLPDAHDRSGLSLGNVPGGFDVVAVRAGTAAARAGVRAGDVIAAVDGKPVLGTPLYLLRALLRRPPGTRVASTMRITGAARPARVVLVFADDLKRVRASTSRARARCPGRDVRCSAASPRGSRVCPPARNSLPS